MRFPRLANAGVLQSDARLINKLFILKFDHTLGSVA